MTIFEFIVSMMITIFAGSALVGCEYIFNKWYFRLICALLILLMSYFAGFHGGHIK